MFRSKLIFDSGTTSQQIQKCHEEVGVIEGEIKGGRKHKKFYIISFCKIAVIILTREVLIHNIHVEYPIPPHYYLFNIMIMFPADTSDSMARNEQFKHYSNKLGLFNSLLFCSAIYEKLLAYKIIYIPTLCKLVNLCLGQYRLETEY